MKDRDAQFDLDIGKSPAIPWPKIVRAGYLIKDHPLYPPYDNRKAVIAFADVHCHYPVPTTLHPNGFTHQCQRIYSTLIDLDPNHRIECIDTALDQLLDILRFSFVGMLDLNRDSLLTDNPD